MNNSNLIKIIKADIFYFCSNKISVLSYVILTIVNFIYSWNKHGNNISEKGFKYLNNLSNAVPVSLFFLVLLLGIISNELNKKKMITYQWLNKNKNKSLVGYILSNICISFLFFLPEIIMFSFLCVKNGVNDSGIVFSAIVYEILKAIIVMINCFRLTVVFSELSYAAKNEAKGFLLSVLYVFIQFLFSYTVLVSLNNRFLSLFLYNCSIPLNMISALECGVYDDAIIGIGAIFGSMILGITIDFLLVGIIMANYLKINSNGILKK